MPQQSSSDGDRLAVGANTEANSVLWRQAVREADPGFIDWVGRTLHETFDAIADEPLPQDFAGLLSRLDKAPDPNHAES